MKLIRILFFLTIIGMLFAFACCKRQDQPGQIEIVWIEDIEEDYAFARTWDYPEGVYKNDYGQLSCDGFCPERTYAMKDSTGRIYTDSLVAFYRLVDTTHQVHSIACEVQCDEYAGTNYIVAQRKHDTVVCYTRCNAATHCSLHLSLFGDKSKATVVLRSIVTGNDISYNYQRGYLIVEEKSWKAGILKAEFDLYFGRDSLSGKPVSWKGKIYTPILNE